MQQTSALTDIANTLQQVYTDACVAHTHGMLCGFLCGGLHINGKMLPLAMHSEITSPQYSQAVLDLYQISCRQLLSLDDSFEMLLPAVEADLALRAKALSDWCEGFLAGIKQSGVIIKDVIVQDILHCIKEIAELEYDKVLFNENDETAYQETLRYVRFAALLVYAEIAAQPSPYYSKYLH